MALFSGSSARRIGVSNAMTAADAEQRGAGLLGLGQTNALGAIGQGRTDALASLGQGYGQARTDLNDNFSGAISRLDPYAQSGLRALGTYENSLGQNGAEGNAAAVSQFQASPGYQYQVDQATDAVARKASALGALGSGNTQAAITDRASQLANQEYGGWQNRLQGLSDRGQQAATAQSGLQAQLGTSLASLGQGQGRDEANVYSNAGQQEAGIHSNFANLGLNNLWNSTGSQIGSLANTVPQAQNAVNSGYSFGANLAGAGLNLLGLGMGGGNTLGGNLLKFAGAGG